MFANLDGTIRQAKASAFGSCASLDAPSPAFEQLFEAVRRTARSIRSTAHKSVHKSCYSRELAFLWEARPQGRRTRGDYYGANRFPAPRGPRRPICAHTITQEHTHATNLYMYTHTHIHRRACIARRDACRDTRHAPDVEIMPSRAPGTARTAPFRTRCTSHWRAPLWACLS